MRAISFASATVASRTGRRSRSPRVHAPAALFHRAARYTIDVAPSTSSLLISRLPALVIRPRRVLPPVECCLGTSPSQAAKCRALGKAPMPGTVAKRRAVSSPRACATISASRAAIRSAVARHCSSSPANTCRACSGKVSSAATSACSSSSLPMPFGTTRPNSAARPGMAFASMVCCLTSSARAECKARTPCCSKLLAATNFASGRDAAAQIAAASAALLLLPRLTDGLTASGAISFTSCPRPLSTRAQWCAAAHASMTTAQRGCRSKRGISSLRRSLRLSCILPLAPMPWSWNTDLAISRPIMVALMVGGSRRRSRRPAPWRIAAVGGRPPHLGRAAARRHPQLAAPGGAAADARAWPAGAVAQRRATRATRSRRHHHPRRRGSDVGDRPDHHDHRRRAGRGVRRRRPLLRRVRRPPRRPARHPLRGAGAAAPGRAPPLRRLRPGHRARSCCPARPREPIHGRRLPEGDRLPRRRKLLGIESSPAFGRAPEGNGCAERFIRILKENLLWVRTFDTVEELRVALLAFRETYNTTWLVERHGFRPPAAIRNEQLPPAALAA